MVIRPESLGESSYPGAPLIIPWHALAEEVVFQKLRSSSLGLTDEEAAIRLAEFGPNTLPVQEGPGIGTIFLHQFKNPLIYILLVAAFISVLIGDAKDALFISAVVMLNAVIGLIQEWKAEKSAGMLRQLLEIHSRVRREGKDRLVPAKDIVPGDIVFLDPGSRIPADIRLLHETRLIIDESLLTGESVGVDKHIMLLEPEIPIHERINMLFAGTTVMAGRGAGIVCATGMRTEVGRVAEAVKITKPARPPLLVRMERFSWLIGLFVLGSSMVLATVALSRGVPLTEVFFLAVALSVSAIPEGLPVGITVALSIASSRMARRNVIVRKLSAVEGLGSCTTIATDKTGTLTVNQQTVREIILPAGVRFTVSGSGYTGEGKASDNEGRKVTGDGSISVLALARAGIICNEGGLFREPDGQWVFQGDAMDVALLALAYKLEMNPDHVRNEIEPIAEVPFDPAQRYAAVYYKEKGIIRIAVKGALEVILPYCERADRIAIGEQIAGLTGRGFRVLAIAEGILVTPPDHYALESARPPLNLLGLVGFLDPIRPDVPDAIRTCREAGIDVVMVTGDHPATALSIARTLGIASGITR